MRIECNGCIDCPFRYDDYSPDSLGKDTVVVCNLAHFLKLPLYLVKSYDSWSVDDVTFTIVGAKAHSSVLLWVGWRRPNTRLIII